MIDTLFKKLKALGYEEKEIISGIQVGNDLFEIRNILSNNKKVMMIVRQDVKLYSVLIELDKETEVDLFSINYTYYGGRHEAYVKSNGFKVCIVCEHNMALIGDCSIRDNFAIYEDKYVIDMHHYVTHRIKDSVSKLYLDNNFMIDSEAEKIYCLYCGEKLLEFDLEVSKDKEKKYYLLERVHNLDDNDIEILRKEKDNAYQKICRRLKYKDVQFRQTSIRNGTEAELWRYFE